MPDRTLHPPSLNNSSGGSRRKSIALHLHKHYELDFVVVKRLQFQPFELSLSLSLWKSGTPVLFECSTVRTGSRSAFERCWAHCSGHGAGFRLAVELGANGLRGSNTHCKHCKCRRRITASADDLVAERTSADGAPDDALNTLERARTSIESDLPKTDGRLAVVQVIHHDRLNLLEIEFALKIRKIYNT